jgi:addiction module HigA family antidote
MIEIRHHPGAYLRELLIWHDMSAADLARETEIPRRAIVELTEARRGIDRPISEGLAGYFGNSAQFWLDLQRGFERCDPGDAGSTGPPGREAE